MLDVATIVKLVSTAAGFWAIGFGAGISRAWIRKLMASV